MQRTKSARRTRRLLTRSCFAGAVVSLALAGLGTAAARDQVLPLPDVFRGAASSQVVSAFLDRDALLPVNDAFRFIALDGTGTYESSNQTARASVLYPGNGAISGPSLACGTFGSQLPKELGPLLDACAQYQYPLTVFADSLDPDGSSTGSAQLGAPSDPISARAVRAVAHADLDSSTTDAAMSNLRVLGLPGFGALDVPLPIPGAPELDPSILVVDNATSTTDQRIDEAGRLVVESVAVLDGVRLVGGLVRIGSIRSTSRVVDDGKGATERSADLEMGDVTVGGVPARVTEDGLVIGSPTGADGPLAQQLTAVVNDLVRGMGIQVSTLSTEEGEEGSGVAFARAGGVLVQFDVDAQGLPLLPGPQGDVDPNGVYTGVILLGQTGATGLAATIEDAPFTPSGSTPELSAGGAPTGSGFGFDSSVTPPADIGGLDGAPAGADTAAPGTAPGTRVASISEALAASRVALAYLAFTLTALAACIGPRFILPARLPGSVP
jgi:hypothetical protein